MSRTSRGPDQNPWVLLGAFAVVGGLLFAMFRLVDTPDEVAATSSQSSTSSAAAPEDTTDAAVSGETASAATELPAFQPGLVIRREVEERQERGEPAGPEIVPASSGRRGSGIALGDLPALDLPVDAAMTGTVTTAVANLPNRVGIGRVAASLRTLTAAEPDFLVLNEVSGRSLGDVRRAAPGYGAYRDPVRDPGRGGNQSMNNVIAWNEDRWTLVDAGRVKLVENDVGFHHKRPFVWDRYATWTTFQRADGSIMSVVGAHMMTNPGKFPRQHGNPALTRTQQYAHGMKVLRGLVSRLERHGPVLVGGDMNSHPGQGRWSAVAQMRAARYTYTKDRGVMYLFHSMSVDRLDSRQVRVASDHPALYARVDLSGWSG
ncbi:hypothetical protein KUV85_08955 [Nocardioides panacisoli]|uniref:endonuclease/exonuclease/phosphatase family protein n=1 Tax=Nocardioides panacisoli TaxID=627624 RepID=UPI001C62ECEE|nr:endonuclease/exonuclease/phosphatase family protein [Nocardioides panacisoli]QYJ02468.1 hypothetical protein KUV85_08955 [Nocardioides panacisoli]